jgi:transcriptional regulator with XRE-family HTH domain
MTSNKEAKYLVAFGENIAQLRHKSSISQEKLADKVGLAVVSIARIEQGRRWTKLSTLHKIARALGVPTDELLKGLKQ